MKDFVTASEILQNAERVLIMSHRSPDGDTIGANLALRTALERAGKSVTSACIDRIPDMYKCFPEIEHFVTDFDEHAFDVFVNVDASSIDQLQFPFKKPFLLEGKIPFLNIDHHVSNARFGTVNIVHPDACSATFILQEFFSFCGWNITQRIATFLLLGHYYDTGSFMHSNSTQEVFRAASDLTKKGADVQLVKKCLFSHEINKLKLWGQILERLNMVEGISVSGVTSEDFQKFNVPTDGIGSIVDYINSTNGANFSMFFSEDAEKGIVKCSTRTRSEDIDLSAFCRTFGGGGHKKASGFRLEGSLQFSEYFRVDSGKESSV